MLALLYLGLAIALGDLLCRRFYRFVSLGHHWATAILVGVLLSTWFTYLAGLAFYRTLEPLLCADLLFFLIAGASIFWLSRRPSKRQLIAPRTPRSAWRDRITLGAVFAAVCVVSMGTLNVNEQGQIHLLGVDPAAFARHSAVAQNFALAHSSTEYRYNTGEPYDYQFLLS